MADGRHLEKIEKLLYLWNLLADFDDLCVILRVSVQGCAFCQFCRYHFPFMVSNSPKTLFWGREQAFSRQNGEIRKLAYYQNYWVDFNQILQNDKDHQVLLVSGSNTHSINPRWRTAAILKNRKIAISPSPSPSPFISFNNVK